MKIFIAGHKGMVGSAIFKKLTNKTDIEIHTVEKKTLDLLDQSRVFQYFCYHNFDLVIDCAAKVGGIHSNNTYRADFIYENLMIEANLIHASYKNDVKKLFEPEIIQAFPQDDWTKNKESEYYKEFQLLILFNNSCLACVISL